MIVERRKGEVGGGGGAANDVVEALVQDSNNLCADFVRGNIIEMMIPGEETVPMAMTLAVKYLTDNPNALHRLTVRL